MQEGTLSIVATPIGNLEDMTLRAIRILKEANVVYAEDTRVSKKLLDHFEIDTSIRRLDAHKEGDMISEVVARLEEGERVAYVSDAGTPGVSDPGARLVRGVREALPECRIETIPGASALTAALSISGVQADEFLFLGFPPHKKGRQTMMKRIGDEERVVVLYESPHRILKLLEELPEYIDEREVVVLRELTKKFEEVHTGTAVAVKEELERESKDRGEFVVIITSQK